MPSYFIFFLHQKCWERRQLRLMEMFKRQIKHWWLHDWYVHYFQHGYCQQKKTFHWKYPVWPGNMWICVSEWTDKAIHLWYISTPFKYAHNYDTYSAAPKCAQEYHSVWQKIVINNAHACGSIKHFAHQSSHVCIQWKVSGLPIVT